MTKHAVFACGCLLALSSALRAAEWQPDPSLTNPQLHRRLYDIGRRYAEANFDPDANLVGTPSKHPPNKKQHATRESAYYAFGLLLTGDPADRTRAQAILRRVVATQDTKPSSPTLGAFGWYAENPPEDPNSAVFDGIVLADVTELDSRTHCLDADVRQMVESAGRLAIAQVLRRNVDPGYTNIALLSTAFAAAGEKLWGIHEAGAFAEAKLDAVTKLIGDGEFSEYLSPTYYGVNVIAAYEAQKYAFSDAFAAKAKALTDHLWKQIAASYHAPTYQLAGPYSRAYGDNMLEYAAALKYALYLALDGAYPLPDTDTDHEWDKGGQIMTAALPITPRPEFKQPTAPWRDFTATNSPPAPVRRLRQYREGNFVLGTVGYQDEWKQKRNLVAYWRNDGPPPTGIRVGFCIDESNETIPAGVPPAQIHFYCQQAQGAAVVSLVASTVIPGEPACSELVFDKAASPSPGPQGSPLIVRDGTMTTYLYPISKEPIPFKTRTDTKTLKVTRSWGTADVLGPLRVLAYLVVFRDSGRPAPDVTDVSLRETATGGTASARVDGAEVSLSFQH